MSDLQQQLEIDLPDKKYFTIGEVSDLCDLKSHVLRYWEQVFPQLKPRKRSGRRYYQREDVELLITIKRLVQDHGYTLAGAKARLEQVDYTQVLLDESQADAGDPIMQKIKQIYVDVLSFKSHLQENY